MYGEEVQISGSGLRSKFEYRYRRAGPRPPRNERKSYHNCECIVCGTFFQTKRGDALHCHNRCTVITCRRKKVRSRLVKNPLIKQLVNSLDPRIDFDPVRWARIERNSSPLAVMKLIKLTYPDSMSGRIVKLKQLDINQLQKKARIM